jgi:hypothetical protein
MKTTSLLSFLDTPELADLGPGPRAGVEPLASLKSKLEKALSELKVTDARAELVRATILLWHDHLDAAHTIAQDIDNRDGSYVHALMHRREPDPDNAKYWFRRVGQHPCYPELVAKVKTLPSSATQNKLTAQFISREQWDAFGFVDACEQATASGASDPIQFLRELQRLEFEVLLNYLAE